MTDSRKLLYDDEIDLYELWMVIWKRKWLVLSVAVIFLMSAFAYIELAPQKYLVEAVLTPTRVVVDGKTVVTTTVTTTTTVRALLTDRLLLEKYLGDGVKLSVSTPRGADLLKVSYTTTKPKEFSKKFATFLTFLQGYKSAPGFSTAVERVRDILLQFDARVKRDEDSLKTLLSEVNRLNLLKNDISAMMKILREKIKVLEAQAKGTEGIDRLFYVNVYQIMALRLDFLMKQEEELSERIVSYRDRIASLEFEMEASRLHRDELEKKLKKVNLFEIVQPPGAVAISKRVSLILAVSAVVGLFVGIFIAFFLNWVEVIKKMGVG